MLKAVFLLVLCSSFVVGQQAVPSQDTSGPAKIPSISGKTLYATHCALCHGADGKGGGAFSSQLKIQPPDLSQLAKKNHGVFPSMHVAETIDGEFAPPAHGSREMPIWGPVFRSMAHGKSDSALRRINNLVNYLGSLQHD